MIASIFSKTRPINYLVIGLTSLLFFVIYQFNDTNWLNDGWKIAQKAVVLVLLFASFVILNQITLKNNLTKINNYAILLFAIFIILFPTIFKNQNVIIANFFLLIALNRLFALQSLKNSKEKIFDAAFWILIAALFHFWCVLYIVLVFIAIIFHVSGDYRNWIIPFLAFFTVTILAFLADLILNNNLLINIYKDINYSFNFSYFENVYQNIALAIFSSITILFFYTQAIDIQNKPLNMQTSYKKILFSFLLGVMIYVLSNHKNNSYLIYCMVPLSILGANFIERIKTNWMKETTLYLLIGIAMLLFFLQL